MADDSYDPTTRLNANGETQRVSRTEVVARFLVELGLLDKEVAMGAPLASHGASVAGLLDRLVESKKLSRIQCERIAEVVRVLVEAAESGDQGENETHSLVGAPISFDGQVSDETVVRAEGAVRSGAGRLGLLGDYELLEEIAKGGMGVVFRARQIRLNRTVALKMIRSAELADQEQVRRFHTEAEAAAKLDHPGIVAVYDVGEFQGQHYYSMAFVAGESLWERVKREGPLVAREAARLISEAAVAVQHAHEADVLHRDLKPQNLLLNQQGKVQVTDFGLAKLQQTGAELTAAGQILGTPAYMPPEQAAGRMDQVGTSADVYALGATLYFLVTGRPPFQASSVHDTLLQVIRNEPVPPRRLDPTIPLDIETICLKCLQKSPVARYESASALAEDLQRFLDDRPILARPLTRVARARKWARRNPAIAGASLTVLAATLFLIVGLSLAYLFTADALEMSEQAVHRERRANEASGRRLSLARGAIDEFYVRIADDPRLKSATLATFRRDLLESTREYYRALAEESPTDPASKLERARALLSLANVLSEFNSLDEGLAMSAQVVEELQDFPPGSAEESMRCATLVKALMLRMTWLAAIDRTECLRQMEQLEEAIVLFRSIAQGPDGAFREAEARKAIGAVWAEFAQPEKAREQLQRTLDLIISAAEEPEASLELTELMAATLYTLATTYRWTGDWSKVEEFARQSAAWSRDYVERAPEYRRLPVRIQESLSIRLLAMSLDKQSRGNEALPFFKDAIAFMDEMAQNHPDVSFFKEEGGVSRARAGGLALRNGDLPLARNYLEQAVADLRPFIEEGQSPALATGFAEAAVSLATMNLGDVRQATAAQLREVLELLQEARQALRDHQWADPREIEFAIYGTQAAMQSGWARFGLQEYAEAATDFETALQMNTQHRVLMRVEVTNCQIGMLRSLAEIPARCQETLTLLPQLAEDPDHHSGLLFNGVTVLAVTYRTATEQAKQFPAEAERWNQLATEALEAGMASLEQLAAEGLLESPLRRRLIREASDFEPFRQLERYDKLTAGWKTDNS